MEAPRADIARACADDAGCSAMRLASLASLAEIVGAPELLATSKLRIDKFKLVLLRRAYSGEVAQEVRTALGRHVPYFARITI
eukprot:6475362-Pyramimonas_sp.AAC.2